MRVEAITVHYEPPPAALSPATASAIDAYSLPRDSRRKDVRIARDGSFAVSVPFTQGAGVYTVVVWVGSDRMTTPVAASNISIRVTDPTAGHSPIVGTH